MNDKKILNFKPLILLQKKEKKNYFFFKTYPVKSNEICLYYMAHHHAFIKHAL